MTFRKHPNESYQYEACPFKAYTEGDKITLEPMTEIPAHELWLYKNPKACESVQKGLHQADKGEIKQRLF